MRFLPETIRIRTPNVTTTDGTTFPATRFALAEVEGQVYGVNGVKGELTLELTSEEVNAVWAAIEPAIQRFIESVRGQHVGT